MKKSIILLSVLVLAAAAFFAGRSWFPASRLQKLQKDISALREQIPLRQKELDEQVSAYVPIKVRLDDLSVDAAAVLRGIPGAVDVKSNGVKNPSKRIIHLLDYHHVSPEDFARGEPDLHSEELDTAYELCLLKVELVQVEQLAILNCLAKHGVDEAWSEGVTEESKSDFFLIAETVKLEEDVVRMSKKVGKNESVSADYRINSLKIGAVGKEFNTGLLKSVLPLDDEKTLVESNSLAPAAMKVRHKAQVQRLSTKGYFALIVLGGLHDLTDELPAGWEYIRVATAGCRGAIGP